MPDTVRRLEISGCDSVHLEHSIIFTLQLSRLSIRSVKYVNIAQHSIGKVDNLFLENIQDLDIRAYASDNRETAETLFMRNVTVRNLEHSTMTPAWKFKNITVMESEFQHVQTQAIETHPSTQLIAFIKCRWGTIEPRSFKLKTNELRIEDNSFNSVTKKAFDIESETATLIKNKFSQAVDNSSFLIRAKEVRILQNNFFAIEAEALAEVQSPQILFTNNIIDRLGSINIFKSQPEAYSTRILHNFLKCSCPSLRYLKKDMDKSNRTQITESFNCLGGISLDQFFQTSDWIHCASNSQHFKPIPTLLLLLAIALLKFSTTITF